MPTLPGSWGSFFALCFVASIWLAVDRCEAGSELLVAESETAAKEGGAGSQHFPTDLFFLTVC